MAVYSRQAGAVRPTGIGRRLRPSYLDAIRGQYGQATQQVLADRARNLQEKQYQEGMDLQRQQFQHTQNVAAEQAKQARRATGISTAQLGLNVADRLKGSFLDQKFNIPGTGGKFGINFGSALPAAAIGFGAAQAFGGSKSGAKKAAIGVGSGLLADLAFGGKDSILGSIGSMIGL